MGPKIWDFVPKEMKHFTTLNGFKDKIKTWKLENFPHRFSRTYLLQIAFITCLLIQTNVIQLRARGTLSVNTSAVVICINFKLTLRKS